MSQILTRNSLPILQTMLVVIITLLKIYCYISLVTTNHIHNVIGATEPGKPKRKMKLDGILSLHVGSRDLYLRWLWDPQGGHLLFRGVRLPGGSRRVLAISGHLFRQI